MHPVTALDMSSLCYAVHCQAEIFSLPLNELILTWKRESAC